MIKIVRKSFPYVLITILLFGLSLLIRDYGNNPNYCDQECLAARSATVHGLAAMPPGNSAFINSHGWPMHAFSKTIDDDSQNSVYINYSVVAILVDLLLAGLVAFVVVTLFRKIKPTIAK